MEHVDKVGGMGAVLKSIYDGGSKNLNLKAKTVYGTLGDYVLKSPKPDGDILRSTSHAFSSEGGLAILFGNIAKKGAVLKTSGVEPEMIRISVGIEHIDDIIADFAQAFQSIAK